MSQRIGIQQGLREVVWWGWGSFGLVRVGEDRLLPNSPERTAASGSTGSGSTTWPPAESAVPSASESASAVASAPTSVAAVRAFPHVSARQWESVGYAVEVGYAGCTAVHRANRWIPNV